MVVRNNSKKSKGKRSRRGLSRSSKNRFAKNHKTFIILGSIALVIGALALMMFVYGGQTQTAYFYDGELGVVKVEYGKETIFRLLQQQILFEDTNVELGDAVSLTDSYTVPGSSEVGTAGDCIGAIELKINRPDGGETSVKTRGGPWGGGETITTSATFTPPTTGTYNGFTIYFYSDCLSSFQTIAEIQQSTNSVTVTDPAPQCDLDPECDAYTHDSDISNGYVESRQCYSVDEDECELVPSSTDYKTTCNDGYRIVGTESSKTASGKKQCEIIPSSEEDCTEDENICGEGQICNPDTAQCISPQCNEDQTQECSDGSTIVVQECVDGIQSDTGNTCPEDDNNNQNNETNGATNETIVKGDCWFVQTNSTSNVKSCVLESETSLVDGSCPSNSFATESACEDTLPADETDDGDGDEDEGLWFGLDPLIWVGIGSTGLIAVVGLVSWMIRRNRGKGGRG